MSGSDFKRMYGVKPETFWMMVKVVRDGKEGSRGSHASIPIPDQILLTGLRQISSQNKAQSTFIS
ncbi:hypothetical protein [Coleofasciculus sp. FACHB-1120]|uniref:hypothetical protein n=1 Tax=Coleofasciculus sp. FACHB-1120 TaxID=2692783 RepID=UPI0019AA4109|nr:hypothetical protein [Coleofasciculus sp. FACHB-1120]MBD2741542.1 hypothetical protein [Coleofasciculus sp. FACHB-1120]